MAEASVIELRAGHGEPRQISLTPGSVLDPTSVGQTGMWRVEGSGVLDVHGYIYFDGKALFVQSADDEVPVMVNRHRVARAWTEVRMPSTIELGEVQLVYRIDTSVFEDADQTVAQPMEENFEPKTAKFDPRLHRAPGPRPAAGTPAEGVVAVAPHAAPARQQAAPPQHEQPREAPRQEPQRQPAPAAFVPPNAPFAGTGPQDNESTRYKPMEIPADRPSQPAFMPPGLAGSGGIDDTRVQRAERPSQPAFMPPGMASPTPAFPPPAALPPGMVGPGSPAMGSQAGQQGWPGGGSVTGPAQLGQAKQASSNSVLAKIKQEFSAYSPIKRAAVVLFVFALPAGAFLVLSDDSAPAPKAESAKKTTVSAASSSGTSPAIPPPTKPPPPLVASAANSAGGASGAAGAAGAGGNSSARPTTTPTPPSAGSSASTASKGAPSPAASSLGKLPSEIPPLTLVMPMPAVKSPERQAADAVVEGQYDTAAKLYEQLAASNPGNPAYREAARIMREAGRTAPGQ